MDWECCTHKDLMRMMVFTPRTERRMQARAGDDNIICDIFCDTFNITVFSVVMRTCCLGNSVILKVLYINGQLVTLKKITECD